MGSLLPDLKTSDEIKKKKSGLSKKSLNFKILVPKQKSQDVGLIKLFGG